MTESQQRLVRTILSGYPGFLVLKNKQLGYEVVNPAFCQFLAKGPDEIIGKRDADLFSGPEAAAAQKEDKAVMDLGTARKCEQPFTGANGVRWFEVTRSPIFDESGDPAGILLFAGDITAFKTREKAIAAGEAKIEAFQQQASEAESRLAQAESELQAALARAAQQDILQAQLKEKDARIAAEQQEIEALQSDFQMAQEELFRRRQEMSELQQTLHLAESRVAQLEAESERARTAQEESARLQQQLREAMEERARAQEQLQASESERRNLQERIQSEAGKVQEIQQLSAALQQRCSEFQEALSARDAALGQAKKTRNDAAAMLQQLLDTLKSQE